MRFVVDSPDEVATVSTKQRQRIGDRRKVLADLWIFFGAMIVEFELDPFRFGRQRFQFIEF